MDGTVFLLVMFMCFCSLKNCEKVSAGPECRLPITLPKITRINTFIKDGDVDFVIELESDPLVRVHPDSLLWHASRENQYMLLPVIDGIDGASVTHSLTQSSPDSKYSLKSHLRAPHIERLTYSLLLKLKLPCTTIHMAIHQPAGDVILPIETGRIEKMPPPEINNPTGPMELEYVITTAMMKNSSEGILMGPLTAPDLGRFNVPWQGEWVEAQSREIFENGRWKEVTNATIEAPASNALYEYDTNHAYVGGRIGISFIIPLLVIQNNETGPQVGFLTCVPSQKLSAEKTNDEIIFYQAFGRASCLKFDYFNTKNAFITLREKPCQGRAQGQRLEPVFGEVAYFRNNYAEQTYYLAAPEMMQHPNDEVCYQLRAVNDFGDEIVSYKIKFYQPTQISAGADRISEEEVKLTCSGTNGGEHMDVDMYHGDLEDYYNPHKLVQDGIEAQRSWTDLKETDLITGPLMGHGSTGSTSKSYTVRLTPGHIASMRNNHQSIFCAIRTRQEFLLEKFVLTAEHLGETIEI